MGLSSLPRRFLDTLFHPLSRKCSVVVLGLIAAASTLSAAPPEQQGPALFDVESHRDITYYDGPGADKAKNKLDLYLPKGQSRFPVVMFVHGGAWFFGDKNFFGLYEG